GNTLRELSTTHCKFSHCAWRALIGTRGFLFLLHHLIDQAELLCFHRSEETVALRFLCNAFDSLVAMPRQDFIETLAVFGEFVRLYFHVGDLPSDLAPRLMDHNLGVWQGVAFPFRAGGQQNRGAAGGHSHAISRNGALEELHRV